MVSTEPVYIGNRRELLWDNYLIDAEQTTARLKLHKLQAKEIVIDHNEPWEGDGCDFHCIVKDDGFYRMYYLGWETLDADAGTLAPRPIVVCYAESEDGLTWVKPKLGMCEFEGTKDNNIILDHHAASFDNFYVFKDSNSACPGEERYKGVALDRNDNFLWCFTSADGINFNKAWRMTDKGVFDSLNVAFWDRHAGQYVAYIRDFHDVPGDDLNAGIRDIRRMVSTDFKSWTDPVLLDFNGGDDYPLYTNVIQPYYRADHQFVGFPSRYVEKKQWTHCFDDLAGAERRKKRMKLHPRLGLAITDCVFMSSRDGEKWQRWDEAFMTPGLETPYNWVYGDCYPAVGLIETTSDRPHAPNELSMYAYDNHWSGIPAKLRRYTMRMDGFVSRSATYKPCTIVTKPFIFAGSRLSINFATSAIGYVKIGLVSERAALDSVELFGDSLDKTVVFEEGDVAALAGEPVVMHIEMSDADLYAFKFD